VAHRLLGLYQQAARRLRFLSTGLHTPHFAAAAAAAIIPPGPTSRQAERMQDPAQKVARMQEAP
jgi:hypothetical protein